MNSKIERFKGKTLYPLISAALTPLDPGVSGKLSKPPFLILGSGRNGSTLLASLLNNHPDLFIPPEQYVFARSFLTWKLRPVFGYRPCVRKIVYQFARFGYNWEIDPEALLAELQMKPNENLGYMGLLDKIYRHYAATRNKRVQFWGDKTPLTTHYIRLLAPAFREARFIFLLRDPRDVLASYKKMKGSAFNLATYTWRWRDSLDTYEWMKSGFGEDRLLLVRYEELVGDPRGALRRILHFLKVNDAPGLLDSLRDVELLGVGRSPDHKRTAHGISTASIGNWKKALTKSEAEKIRLSLKKYLGKYGYA